MALEDSLRDVESALEINPLAGDALQLREEIEAVLAELNLVQSPGELNPIADLSRFGPAIALGTVRFGAGRAFVLDDAGGRVFSVSADGTVSVIFLEGELLGLAGQLRTGKPVIARLAVNAIDAVGPERTDRQPVGCDGSRRRALDS